MAVESVSLKTVELLADKVLGFFGCNTFLDTNIHSPFSCWDFRGGNIANSVSELPYLHIPSSVRPQR